MKSHANNNTIIQKSSDFISKPKKQHLGHFRKRIQQTRGQNQTCNLHK